MVCKTKGVGEGRGVGLQCDNDRSVICSKICGFFSWVIKQNGCRYSYPVVTSSI